MHVLEQEEQFPKTPIENELLRILWQNTLLFICKLQLTFEPFLLPGKLTIREFLRIPDTALESIANLVILSDSIKMAVAKLLASLSITNLVASGV